jgi:hypothetical protein
MPPPPPPFRESSSHSLPPLISFYLHGGDYDGGGALAETLIYLANDLLLQSHSESSSPAMGAAADNSEADILQEGTVSCDDDAQCGAGDACGASPAAAAARLAAAIRNFAAAIVRAVATGPRAAVTGGSSYSGGRAVVVVVDGLPAADVQALVRLVLRLEEDVIAGLRRVAPHRAAGAAIRAVFTCRRPPPAADLPPLAVARCRVVELGPLSLVEREAVARHWILHNSGRADPPSELVRLAADKAAAATSPLYLAALCHTNVRIFATTVPEDSAAGGDGGFDGDPAEDAAARLREVPDGLVSLFATGLLPCLEARHGRPLVAEVRPMSCPFLVYLFSPFFFLRNFVHPHFFAGNEGLPAHFLS